MFNVAIASRLRALLIWPGVYHWTVGKLDLITRKYVSGVDTAFDSVHRFFLARMRVMLINGGDALVSFHLFKVLKLCLFTN
jgi:hypothetical protein